jgi:hypothetical protein
MADKHPYVQGPGALVQVVTHFRKSFPATVNASTLQKLGFAPKNESYVLNVLRFLGLIDHEGNRTAEATRTFNLHEDTAFKEAFAALVSKAYFDLFELHSEATWSLDNAALITFFRSQDETTALVGKLQASTFKVLAAYSGHGDIPVTKIPGAKAQKPAAKAVPKEVAPATPLASKSALSQGRSNNTSSVVGLTVRIEINLPADGDQETYDRIFKSIRENLLNG